MVLDARRTAIFEAWVDWDPNPEPTPKAFGAALLIELLRVVVQLVNSQLRILFGVESSLHFSSRLDASHLLDHNNFQRLAEGSLSHFLLTFGISESSFGCGLFGPMGSQKPFLTDSKIKRPSKCDPTKVTTKSITVPIRFSPSVDQMILRNPLILLPR